MFNILPFDCQYCNQRWWLIVLLWWWWWQRWLWWQSSWAISAGAARYPDHLSWSLINIIQILIIFIIWSSSSAVSWPPGGIPNLSRLQGCCTLYRRSCPTGCDYHDDDDNGNYSRFRSQNGLSSQSLWKSLTGSETFCQKLCQKTLSSYLAKRLQI